MFFLLRNPGPTRNKVWGTSGWLQDAVIVRTWGAAVRRPYAGVRKDRSPAVGGGLSYLQAIL